MSKTITEGFGVSAYNSTHSGAAHKHAVNNRFPYPKSQGKMGGDPRAVFKSSKMVNSGNSLDKSHDYQQSTFRKSKGDLSTIQQQKSTTRNSKEGGVL
jgi:hypothetical protein